MTTWLHLLQPTTDESVRLISAYLDHKKRSELCRAETPAPRDKAQVRNYLPTRLATSGDSSTHQLHSFYTERARLSHPSGCEPLIESQDFEERSELKIGTIILTPHVISTILSVYLVNEYAGEELKQR